ncbi:UNVERIFIED_CONTAM: AP-5 complex subunit mu [Sesamum angustifolium]|uniref:AP-5 complex subunit mu n=1 Tax=Sesamum angustifolium TaxID=2727405 RepID=A0AAW2P281_9LAMI
MSSNEKVKMPRGCYIRALWILNNQDFVVFSRKFPVVEKRWRAACDKESDDDFKYNLLPYDSELAAAFIDRKKREGSARGFGLRLSHSAKGSDSWVDDPITRHVISLYINKEEKGENFLLWPLLVHIKGPYSILVLPLVEPQHLKSYSRMSDRPDCGSAIGADENLSSLLLDLPSITGGFNVAHTIGDIIVGEAMEPEVVVAAAPSVGGLLDSLTGSIGITGISARAKPVAAPLAASTVSGIAVSGAVMSDAPKMGSRPLDKDALRSFISSSMPFGWYSFLWYFSSRIVLQSFGVNALRILTGIPFTSLFAVGTPLDMSYLNISAIKTTGFSSADVPPAERKQPAWKPYLYRGKQRILFTIYDTVHAAMYDRDEIPDSITISGQVNCRAELEGLPDVSFPLTGLDTARIESLSFHPCAQVPEHGGAFLFKLSIMEGYKAPVTIEFCTVTMPFPRRRVVSFDGTPSIGTVSYTDHSVEWKIITNTRSVSGKSIEATFPGTVRFAPWQAQKMPLSGLALGSMTDEDSDLETESGGSVVNVEDYIMEKMSKDLQAVDLEEPFCWQAYNYAKVSFKMVGPSMSGMSIDPKSVNIFPAVKAPVEISTQVTSGDYILWNTLGKCPVAATPEV